MCSNSQARLTDTHRLPGFAAELLLIRRARGDAASAGIFCDPVWEMLLALYSEGTALSPGRLGDVTGLPQSTARRWVAVLEAYCLAGRPGTGEPDLVSITDEGRRLVERSLRAILAAAQH